MRRAILLGAVLLLIAPGARAQKFSSSTIKSVEVFRTDQISAGGVAAQLGPLLSDWARLRFERRKDKVKETKRLEEQITSKVRDMGSFAFVAPYYGEYVTSAQRSVYLTFDVVDLTGFEARMPFRRPPAGKLADPGGLLAAWRQYDQKGLDLEARGLISTEEHPSCPGFYCLWGAPVPELATLEQRLAAGAEPNKAALFKIVLEDADPKRRADALYVLSYTKDGDGFARILLNALTDPGEEPRGAALTMLSELAVYHKDVFIDPARVVPVLDYPTVADRSKALAVVMAMVVNPAYKPYLLTRATPYLIPLLKLWQPGNHDLAFTILSVLSGASYDSRDYDSWEKWVQSVSKDAPPTPLKNAR